MMHRLALLVTCFALTAAWAEEPTVTLGKSTFVGGKIEITEPVEGGLRVAGGEVTVSAPVGGSAHIAAGKVTITGEIKGNLRIAAGRVLLDGPVGGNASVAAGTLELGPNARLAGSLTYRGANLERDPAAKVEGPLEVRQGRYGHEYEFDPFRKYSRGWIWTGGLMLLAGIIAAALPGTTRRMTAELREHPWTAPLIGFIALTCVPVAAVLIMITIIGIPIGLLALLGWLALLLVGYVWLSVVVGGLLLDHYKADVASQTAWRIGAAVLAMLALALLARLPFVGGWIAFAALIVGVGMVVATIFRKREQQQQPPAAAVA